MAVERRRVQPRTFYLNETHELASGEKVGGGRLPAYAPIPWAAKAKRINGSIQRVEKLIVASNDPLKEDRFFVLANPVREVQKLSNDKKKAPTGTFKEKTDFGGTHSRVFDRLGMDLLKVTENGQAIVHAKRSTVDQLRERSASLETLGAREQSRWVTIDSFELIPLHLRVDQEWLNRLTGEAPAEVIFELQPVLTRLEVERVLRAIAAQLRGSEKLTGTGTDFSGRRWLRGLANRDSIQRIGGDFFSVQSIHSPLYSVAAGRTKGRAPATLAAPPPPIDATALPCVAVLDLGVPADHSKLRPYRRGQFVPLNAPRPPIGDHGSYVASRVVFGDCESHDALSDCVGLCSYYDGMVGDHTAGVRNSNRIWDKFVMEVLRGIAGAAPDVRVFNLSFGNERPLSAFSEVERNEHQVNLRDLDNFVFANDSIVVVAAGNSPSGSIPNPQYPEHYKDPRWALGPWACGFNTLVCGAFVSRLTTAGLVTEVGWPSPFSRIGPGLCGAPIPSFSAEGGNTDDAYGYAPDLGVWCLSGAGLPEDKIGTSFAAPLLAREAALTLDRLQHQCAPGSRPFAVTARAFLTLTATPPRRSTQSRS
ncbi:MAG: S8 family serine peptidase [Isosphaeraceae bacterium]